MMGSSHAATGVLAGAAVGALAGTEVTDVLVCAAVGAGAALLPDLDEPGSSVGRSLGLLSERTSVGLRALSRRVYTATGTRHELEAGKDGGHRHLTHTVPAVLVFGLLGFLVAAVAPLGTAVVVFAMAALGTGTVARSLKGRKRGRGITVALLAMVCATTAEYAPGGAPWLIGVTVAVGALTHVLGDWLTRSGVPLAWPFRVNGKRWWMFRSPLAFHTGRSPVEVGIRWASLLAAPLMLLVAVPVAPAGS